MSLIFEFVTVFHNRPAFNTSRLCFCFVFAVDCFPLHHPLATISHWKKKLQSLLTILWQQRICSLVWAVLLYCLGTWVSELSPSAYALKDSTSHILHGLPSNPRHGTSLTRVESLQRLSCYENINLRIEIKRFCAIRNLVAIEMTSTTKLFIGYVTRKFQTGLVSY